MIYLDHNASTPVRPEVAEAMAAGLNDLYANPSSMHREGQRARAAIERAREQVAALVHAHADEVVFTSGGTEGDHLAILGAAWARAQQGRRVALSAIEHHAVHGAGAVLADQGWTVDHLACAPDGRVDPATAAIAPGTALVSLMLANNETGVLQPVAEWSRRAHAAGALLHCDAVQAAGKVPVDFEALEADYLVVSAHKLSGPKGAGALVVRRGAPLAPLFRGSGHERGRRGGTENLPGIVGLGVAAECAARDLAAESARLVALKRRLESGLREIAPDAVIHGEAAPRLPNTVNVSFPGARSDHLLMALDARGVAVSAGAACASGAVEPSPVLNAMGVPRALAVCAVRLSLGRTSTAAEVEAALAALREAVPAAVAAGARAPAAGTRA
ncbi:MAG: cysteine desulfurase [Candidatus Eisenbacteria bacterium]|uniref:Cysteine desulfurase n=1 Tax=Eiseniibacteriota bacterium TaxID=2212470 RepID=A0A538TZ91_UNCEI|nr:MAG: cysteine desulfurase [Candidatus Eisenbacteria bacterium]